MALTTLGAIALGTAAVGGVASASIGAGAARNAARTSAQATAESNALAREVYAQNRQTLAPFVQQGTAATSYINQLLGIQTPQAQPQPLPGMAGGVQQPGGMANPDNAFSGGGFLGNRIGQAIAERNNMAAAGQFMPSGTVNTPALPQGAAANAFDAFRNSTGYNFRLNEGIRAINANQAVRGLMNSGSTLKAVQELGQNKASAEFGNYLNTLLGQQSLGANSAAAQAGVAQNFSSQVQQNNAANAANQGNASLAQANIIGNAIGGVTGTLGYLAGRG